MEMPSARSRVVRSLIVKRLMRHVATLNGRTIDEYRHRQEALAKHQILPRGTRVEQVSIEGLRAEFVRAKDVSAGDARTILYFHGGGYIAGSCSTHRDLATRLSAACGGVALATLLALRDGKEELPKAAFLLSPWLSQIPDGESYRARAALDPLI